MNLLLLEVVLWVGLTTSTVLHHSRRGKWGVGLVAAYLLNLSLIHLPGAMVTLLPWYNSYYAAWTDSGFQLSLWGIVAFCLGTLAIPTSGPILSDTPSVYDAGGVSRLPLHFIYFILGIISLLAYPYAASVPTLRAIVVSGQLLIIIGICLGIYRGWQNGNTWNIWIWGSLALLLPIITLIRIGFLGYGMMHLSVVAMYLGLRYRLRKYHFLLAFLAIYLLLSVYVTYMRDRTILRFVVWGGESYSQRTDVAFNMFSNFEWFDVHSTDQLDRIDVRLNQNWLVGASIEQTSRYNTPLLQGESIRDGFLALIPRVIWPNKPITAGSGNLVTRFTGVPFGVGTSVGVGQILELYINFGSAGVVAGSFFMGLVIAYFDQRAAAYLHLGDKGQFAMWMVAGIAIIQFTGGSVVDAMGSMAAGFALVYGINQGLILVILHRLPVRTVVNSRLHSDLWLR